MVAYLVGASDEYSSHREGEGECSDCRRMVAGRILRSIVRSLSIENDGVAAISTRTNESTGRHLTYGYSCEQHPYMATSTPFVQVERCL